MSRRAMQVAMMGVTVIVAGGLAGCGESTAPAVTPPPAQLIAFQSRRVTGQPNLFVMNQNGDSVVPVLTGLENDLSPVLSPDASRIAFNSDRDGGQHIYVINVDGTGLQPVTSDTFADVEPSWSPDGTRLAFARSSRTADGNGLRTIRPDGSDLRIVTTVGGELDPAWSPDGTRIAFSSGGHIFVVGVTGDGLQPLTDTMTAAGYPAWSPDGTRIAFAAIVRSAGVADIFVMNADGSGLANLTQTPTMGEAQPAWSPDGKFIVFAGARRFDSEHILGNMEIVRRAADGSGEVILTNLPAEDVHPSWARRPH